MTPVELLRKARARIERPECWTKGANARNQNGDITYAPGDAVCWCMDGAIYEVIYGTAHCPDAVRIRARDLLTQATGLSRIFLFNDATKTRHEDALAAYDKAIALALAQQETTK